jgi:UDP-N-acetylmuramate dehydrogenase
MNPEKYISLKSYHFFASDEKAHFFSRISNANDIDELVNWSALNKMPFLILGSGSNVLFTKDFKGIVAKMEIKGIQKINETPSEVTLKVGAGENWHHFVSYCVQKGWGGLENLSLIPGTVGASPIQNIGAYGVEVQECIQEINAFETSTHQWIKLSNKDCDFGYHTSIFKKYPNRFIITHVQFVLQKQPKLKTDYGAIREILHDKGIKNPSLADVAAGVTQIRTCKFPDPKIVANAGSFFKNPIVSLEKYKLLEKTFPILIAHPISDTNYKIAAGWLIEHCGWKGIRKGNVGCYKNQALVIVSYEIASGQEVFDFSEEIIKDVKNKFDIVLEREVNVY